MHPHGNPAFVFTLLDDRRDRTPSGGTSGDIGSAGTLPTSAEARNSAMDRQKQLYAKRRTEIATGGMFEVVIHLNWCERARACVCVRWLCLSFELN